MNNLVSTVENSTYISPQEPSQLYLNRDWTEKNVSYLKTVINQGKSFLENLKLTLYYWKITVKYKNSVNIKIVFNVFINVKDYSDRGKDYNKLFDLGLNLFSFLYSIV